MNDEINNPSHYMLFPDMEAIDVIKAALTPEEFAGYCKGNALKYRLRAGEKGPVEKCIAKACWYQNKLRQVTRADFGQQNTIDCRTDEEKAKQVESVFAVACLVCGGNHSGLQCPHLKVTAAQVGA
ncbi:DUF3310 domain-containing protein [Pseudomonas songnenensis]|uniref:DUF3310 domain-containing protein n=1 Tax=Pseudomonas songnenensis TaxID=1176259 RepID=A0A482UIK6_9PSED|nr:DUF3310 domain-containing protein [Pseudomonas songnenensis]RYJ63230.1 DUF3310 domain-containing protein [Pseudomonas songnenensis]